MDIICVCKQCGGAGFSREPWESLHPSRNMAYAKVEYADGHREPFSAWTPTNGEARFAVFECQPCGGLGETTWVRGKSLTPVIP